MSLVKKIKLLTLSWTTTMKMNKRSTELGVLFQARLPLSTTAANKYKCKPCSMSRAGCQTLLKWKTLCLAASYVKLKNRPCLKEQ